MYSVGIVGHCNASEIYGWCLTSHHLHPVRVSRSQLNRVLLSVWRLSACISADIYLEACYHNVWRLQARGERLLTAHTTFSSRRCSKPSTMIAHSVRTELRCDVAMRTPSIQLCMNSLAKYDHSRSGTPEQVKLL